MLQCHFTVKLQRCFANEETSPADHRQHGCDNQISNIAFYGRTFHSHTSLWSPGSPDLFWPQVEIKGLNKNVFSKRRLIVLALEVKVGGVRESMDTWVSPAGDWQRHGVERLQPPYCILRTDRENIKEIETNCGLLYWKKTKQQQQLLNTNSQMS